MKPSPNYMLTNIKVRSVAPGSVHFDKESRKWRYTVAVNGSAVIWPDLLHSAAQAKQVMRQKVAWLHRRHCV